MNALSERLTDIKENGDRSTEAMQAQTCDQYFDKVQQQVFKQYSAV